MIKGKVEVIYTDQRSHFQTQMNEFLSKIDIRQIIKTEYAMSSYGEYGKTNYSAIIYYVNLEDIRDAKLDNVLEIK